MLQRDACLIAQKEIKFEKKRKKEEGKRNNDPGHTPTIISNCRRIPMCWVESFV